MPDTPDIVEMTDLVERIRAACIPWPHRLLHEAAAEITHLRAELDNARSKITQAYQVMGVMQMHEGTIIMLGSEQKRVLDYFADTEAYDEEFLPWPR